jgi:tripartite-type tricarboxylate transporter receptor subunit TctC
MRKLLFVATIIVGLTFVRQITLSAAPYYEGKTIRITVGVSAGGGFDNEARILSRHMPKYIPGKPTIIVENVTGAGGLICANQLYKLAVPDGLTFSHFNGSNIHDGQLYVSDQFKGLWFRKNVLRGYSVREWKRINERKSLRPALRV